MTSSSKDVVKKDVDVVSHGTTNVMPTISRCAKRYTAHRGFFVVRPRVRAHENFEREAAKGASLYTGLRDITPVWRVLLPRLFTKIVEDWRAPDSPFWVVQSKNTANNGVKAHAGALLATTRAGGHVRGGAQQKPEDEGRVRFSRIVRDGGLLAG